MFKQIYSVAYRVKVTKVTLSAAFCQLFENNCREISKIFIQTHFFAIFRIPKTNCMRQITLGIFFFLFSFFTVCAQSSPKKQLEKGYEHVLAQNPEAALEIAEKLIFDNPKFFEAYGLRGLANFILGNNETVFDDLNFAIEKGSKNVYVLVTRGKIFGYAKRSKLALADFEEAIKYNKNSPVGYLERAQFYLYEDKAYLCIQDCKKAIELDPTISTGYMKIAIAYQDLGNHDKARENLNIASRLESNSPTTIEYLLGRSDFFERKFESAIVHLKKSIELDSANHLAIRLLAENYLQIEEFDEAIKAFQKNIRIDSTDDVPIGNIGLIYAEMDKFPEAIEYLSRAIKLDGGNKLDFLKSRALLCFRNRDFRNSAEDYSELISYYPKDPMMFVHRAEAYKEMGNYQLAHKDLESALRIEPELFEAKMELVMLYRDQKNLSAAADLAKKLIEKQPKFSFTYQLVGELEYSLENYESSVDYLTKSLELKGVDSVLSYSARSLSYLKLNREAEALEDTKLAEKISSNNSNVVSNLSFSYGQLGLYEESLIFADKALQMDSLMPYTYNNRGYAKYKLGDYEGAIKDFNKSIELKNDYYYWPPYNRANAFRALKRFDEAISDFNLAIGYKADYHEAYNDRGETYEQMGQIEKAIQDFEKALEINPDYQIAKDNLARLKH